MIKTRIIKSGLRTAWTHKLRSLFMVISIMTGIASLTVIISLGKGTEKKLTDRVKKLFSPNTIMVVSGAGKIDASKHSISAGTLKTADIQDIAQRVENVIEWDAVQIMPDKQISFNSRNTIANISGQTPAAENVWNLEVTSGRFFSSAEDQGLARVAVIAPNAQKELFGNSNPLGQQIKIENIPFQVIGIIGPRGIDPHGIDKDNEIIIPLNTLLRRTANLDYIMMGKLLVADESQINSSADQVTNILRERHSINSKENDDFMIVTPVKVKQMIKNATRIFDLYLPLIAIVSLLAGIIVVVNLMLLSLSERVKEIGLRKAVGAKSKDILMQFLVEAASITSLSGIIGIVIGVLVLTQLTKFMNLPFSISPGTIIACFFISALAGIAAGVLPAMKAAALLPAESLK